MTETPEVHDALQKRDIEDLTKEMRDGFKGVHERQNVTNGKVLKAAADITELEKVNIRRSVERKYEKLIWYLFTGAMSIIVGLASYIIYHYHP